MKIRTKLILSVVFFGIAMLIIAGSVVLTNQHVDRLNTQKNLANKIETKAGDLGYLSSDYVLYPDNQQAEQWLSKYSAISSDLSALTVNTPEQQILLDSLKTDQQRLKIVFDDIHSSTENASQGNSAIDPQATRVSWNRLAVQILGMVSDSARLSQLLNDETDQVKSVGNLLILLLLGTFSLFVLTSYLIIFRRALSSIEDLQVGAKVIGSGDLNFSIPERGDDEIHDLSRAFNRMTASLKDITASKADLEHEIIVRRKAEEEVGEKNEELNILNEELTTAHDELLENINKLILAEKNLKEANDLLEHRVTERTAQLEKVSKDSGAERQRLYDVLEALPVYVCLLDGNYHMPFANRYFRETFGESHGRCCYDFLFDRTSPCETCETYTVMRTRASHHWYWTGPNNKDYDIYDFPFIDTNGSFLILEMGIDITENKKAVAALREANDLLETRVQERTKELRQKNIDLNALNEEITATQEELQQNIEELVSRESQLNDALAEKDILLSEIHHRVKNNLAAFISLLGLEGSYDESPAGKSLKKDLQNRARSMALIHETLYKTHRYSDVDMEVYLSTLVSQVVDSYRSAQSVRTVLEAKGVTLDLARATPTGLIVNELITNSLKYAFPPKFDCMAIRGEPCTIRVSLIREDGTHLLTVSDNGSGLPSEINPLATKSLGLKLVNFLARHQLRAKIEVRTDKGTEFIFRLNKGEDYA